MHFIKKFLLAYFGAIGATIALFFVLQFAFVSVFGLFLFADNKVSRAFFTAVANAEIFISVLYGVVLVGVTWFAAVRKGWQRTEWLLLVAVSVVTWAIVFAAYRAQESEQITLSQQQEQAREDLGAQVMRISDAYTRFIGIDTSTPRYEGIVRVGNGVPGTYEYVITVNAGGITRVFGPATVSLSSEHEGPALPPFRIAVDEVARAWAQKNMSTTAVQTGFELSFNVAATLRLVEDARGLLINGAPMDVNSFLASDGIFVQWDHGVMTFSERRKAGAEGDACTSFFDCEEIVCPELDERGCGYLKTCQQGQCVCQVVCS